MSKRALYTGVLLVATQLASGCCCVRESLWRWRCAPCGNGSCAPSYRPMMPPIASHPVASAPVFHHGGGPDCVGCASPGGAVVGHAGGIPMIGSPMNLGGPTIERTNELPHPMPNKDGKEKN